MSSLSRARRAAAVTLAGGLLAGCTSTTAPEVSAPASAGSQPPGTSTMPSSTQSAPTPTRSPTTSTPGSPTAAPTAGLPSPSAPPVTQPISLPALMAKTYDGHGLTLGPERGSTAAYRQYFVTYQGGGLRISGRINIPRGQGPFPAVVLAHGYVDPAEYTNGETMLRERDYLARQGYITLHIDYRNHAESDKDPAAEANLRLGYTEDAINAALALKQHPAVDGDRIALIGRSMGGGVVYNALVVKPGLFKAAVAYAPVSSDTVDNFNTWTRRDSDRAGASAALIKALGTPESSPQTWALTSPRTYFDRITEPLMIHHGTADEECPIEWTTATQSALKSAGVPVTVHVYPGQKHTFTSQWPLSIRRSEAFLKQHLR